VSARLFMVLVVVAAHGLVLWLFWRVRAPVIDEVETFTSLMFFVPAPQPAAPAAPVTHRAGRAAAIGNTSPAAPVALPPPPDTGTAITLPAPPGAGVDWSAQLPGAAQAELDNEKKLHEQLGALLRKFRIEDDPRNPHPAPSSSFRWYDAGIHRIDTRGPLPVWHLNDRCVMLAFIFPACAIGHIEAHGDLFDGAAAAHAEKLATPRPNDVP
jgi:hypothetical protein